VGDLEDVQDGGGVALGAPIPTNDLWIAALVLQHDRALFARDRHFDVLPQLLRT
jgi:predicted nucleic acid-binding protein